MPGIVRKICHRWTTLLFGRPLGLGTALGTGLGHLPFDLVEVQLDEPEKSDVADLLTVLVRLGEPG